jgi:hypothetical protein
MKKRVVQKLFDVAKLHSFGCLRMSQKMLYMTIKKIVESHTTVLCIGMQFCAVSFFERCKMHSSRKNYLKKNKSSNEVCDVNLTSKISNC